VVEWDQYATAWADRHGGYDQRRAPAPVRGWLRLGYRIAQALAAVRVQPATVAAAGLVAAAAVPLAAGADPAGVLIVAGLVLLSSLAGTVDRSLRVLTAQVTAGGAIAEAVAARLGEVAWLVGFWLLGVPGPLVLGCGVVTGLYEYLRTQALLAGASPIGTQTLADRPMRGVVAVAGLVLAGLAGFAGRQLGSGLLTLAMAGWLILTAHGLGQLASGVRRSVR
jgi:CDP-diacylglycerol--glycerol-3-phosphate 3-phosphatidyltransferase